ncbi:Protein of unknown function DUF2911 (plasmid) [Gemmatirosa kalamazoonensis]|uniref:DUF2911 domain-containing protein n=1 Tax=Gemmatirosa kalamazoonensis TaxID=861299 RepID=W0RP80_9BACT|nr:DUF2911 domain-containing protein [Gemmatirosa kalamazoonensis]AHG92292.1 Protein of unknown function DUF2911 [Gemmatirosa kalamazoonensis]
MRPHLLILAASLLPLAPLSAQSRGYIARLGVDTVAVEWIARHGNVVEGRVVRHTPATSVLRYTLALNPDGTVASYDEGVYRADGSPLPDAPDGTAQTGLSMRFVGDSVIRRVTRGGAVVERRGFAPRGTLPAVGGTSPYWQELAIAESRRAGTPYFRFIGFAAGQDTASVIPVRRIGADSVEIVAGGFPRAYRVARDGRIVRGDGARTTVKLVIEPLERADLAAIATAWAAMDARGQGMGVPSTRDTVTATVGGAQLWLDYGRPAKRGRAIWGALVPLDTVWRFGANAAAQFRTDAALDIGGTTVPAGTYSLWLLPSAAQSYLIVNRQTGQWGTMYDASQDLVRIPVARVTNVAPREERFRVLVDGGRLRMLWDDGGYEVPIAPAGR